MTHPGQVLGPDVRAGVAWLISSYSTNGGGNCVEVAALPGTSGGIAVRHSRHPDDLVLILDQHPWAAFVGGVKNGEFTSTLTAP